MWVYVCVCACVYLSVYVSMTQGFLSLKLSARNCYVTCILKILRNLLNVVEHSNFIINCLIRLGNNRS